MRAPGAWGPPSAPEPEKEDGRKRSRWSILLPLFLMLATVFCCAQAGVLMTGPEALEAQIEPIQTADYGPWPWINFAAVDPLLGTAAAVDEVIRQGATPEPVTAVAGMVTATPTADTYPFLPTATVPTSTSTWPPIPVMTYTPSPTLYLSPTASSTPTPTPTATEPAPPAADFAASPLSGVAPLMVRFTNRSTGEIFSYLWDFGDAVGSSDSESPSYTYTHPGTYPVSLFVSGPYGSDFASATITVLAPTPDTADLAASMSVNTPVPVEGQAIIFTVMLTNIGPAAATGIRAVDLLPAGLTLTSAWASHGTYDSGSGLWAVSELDGGVSATLTLNATVNLGTGGTTITNTADITARDQLDLVTSNDHTSLTITILSPTPVSHDADLVLSKTVNNPTPSVGSTVTFTIAVTNNGPVAASGIQVRDLIPAGLTFSGATPDQGTYNSGTGNWDVGSLGVGVSATLTLTATVNAGTAGSTITNTASITALDQTDPNSGNNGASRSITVAIPPVPRADLAVGMSVDNSTPMELDTLTYTVTVTNNGPDNATTVGLTDSLPAGLTYASSTASRGSYNSGTGVWSVGGLGVGASATLTLTATVNVGTAGMTLTNTASISALDQTDPNPGNNSAAVLVVVQSADLGLSKTVDNPTPNEGDTITYTVTLINGGPLGATNVAVTDSLPPGLTYASSTASQGSYASGSGVWTVGSLASGASAALTITTTVNAGTAGTIIMNGAAVTAADQPDPNGANDSASVPVTVQSADLGVTKTVDNPTPNEGSAINYGVTITNGGPYDATNVVVADGLPAGVTYAAALASQGSYASGTGIWTVGSLNNGASALLVITASVNAGTAGSTITNTATATGLDQADPNAANDSASAAITVQSADLGVTKTVDDLTPSEGDAVTYTIMLTNGGPNDATNVALTDALPAGVTYVFSTPSQGSYASGTGVWSVGSLNSGITAILTITGTVDVGTAASMITNTAAVTAADQGDPNAANDGSSAAITVRGADLAVAKVVDSLTPNEGDTINYTIAISNNGPDNTAGVALTDVLPVGVTYVAAAPSQGSYASGTGVWSVGSLNSGSGAVLTLTTTVDAGTAGSTITNTAAVSASDEGDSVAANNSASAAITVLSADLGVTKTVSDSTPDEGDTINYTVTLTNNGPADATTITVTDALPVGVTYVASAPSQGGYASGTGVWTVGSLNSGSSATLTLTATVNAGTAGSTITNTAAVSALDQADPNAANDSASAAITVQSADLGVTKTVSDSTPDEGDTITYTVTLTNNGPDNATGVALTDVLPGGVTYVASAPSQGSYASGTGVWTVGSLNSGASAALTLTATVNAGTAGSTITNTAAVSALDQTDPNAANDSASAAITVRSADLGVTKTVDNPTPNEGSPVTFTLTVTNSGPDNATGVQIRDLLPAGMTYNSDTGGGAYNSGTGVWTVGAVAVGAPVSLNIVAQPNLGTGGNPITNTASVLAADQGDPNAANDSASVVINVQGGEPDIGPPDGSNLTLLCGQQLTLDLTFSPIVTHPGYDLVYYEYNNAGTVYMDSIIVEVAANAGGPWWQVFYWGDDVLDANTNLGAAGWGAGSEPDAHAIPATNPPFYGTPPYATGIAMDVDAVAPSGTYTWARFTVPAVDCSETEIDAVEVLPPLPTDLAVTKIDSADPVFAGDTITYTVSVSNTGSDAGNVVLTDTLPGGVNFVSATPDQGSCAEAGGVVTCSLGTVTNGSTVDVAVVVQTTTAGSLTNTASVTSTAPDTNGSNNSASEGTTVNPAVGFADLGVTKTVDDSTPNEGDTITYAVTLSNSGPDDATAVVVTDALPAGVTYASAAPSQGSYDSGTGAWTVGTVDSGASATLLLDATVDAGTGGLTIASTAAVTAADQNDPGPNPNSAGASITVAQADLSIVQGEDVDPVTVGSSVTYTLTVANGGPDPANNVAVSGVLGGAASTLQSVTPSQGTCGGSYLCNLGVIASGGSATITVVVRADAAGTITHDASVSADESDPNAADNSSSESTTAIAASADLRLTAAVDNVMPDVGATINYTFTLTNDGPDGATGVQVAVPQPAAGLFTTLGAGVSQGSYDDLPDPAIWTVGDLTGGSSATLTLTYTVNPAAAGLTITRTGEVSASDQADPDSTPNNGAPAEDDWASVDILVGSADLLIDVTVTDPIPDEGSLITYTLSLTNNGPTDTTGVQVTDLLPVGVSYQSHASPTGHTSYNSGSGLWDVGSLDSGANAQLTITVQVGYGTAGLPITNAASVTASAYSDPNPGDNADSVGIVPRGSDLEISKTVSNAAPNPGDTITYTVTVNNLGPGGASGVQVVDVLPAGVSYGSHVAAVGTYDSGSGLWDIGAFAGSATLDITVTVTAAPGDTVTNTATITAADLTDPNPGNDSSGVDFTVP